MRVKAEAKIKWWKLKKTNTEQSPGRSWVVGKLYQIWERSAEPRNCQEGVSYGQRKEDKEMVVE